MIAGNLFQQTDAAEIGVCSRIEIRAREDRTGMRQRVHFQRKPFFDPGFVLGIGRIDRVAHDADWRASIDLFEAINDRTQHDLIRPRLPHIIDRENDHGLHAAFADPLRRGQFWKIDPNIKRI